MFEIKNICILQHPKICMHGVLTLEEINERNYSIYNFILNVQPLKDFSYDFYGENISSCGGYWIYNNKKYTDLMDIVLELYGWFV